VRFWLLFGLWQCLVLCVQVGNVLALMCTQQLRTVHLDAKQFFAAPFRAMANSRQLTRYVVLDCEPCGERDQRFQLADVQVARESDFGVNNVAFSGRTHLGPFLDAGDMALGYDLARFVTSDEALEEYVQLGYQVPDFILVKKDFSEARARRRAQRRSRPWKVRHLQMEAADSNIHARKNKAPALAAAEEEEQFLQVSA
jgi:nonsense-mediated mRNA decay protein 3